MTKPTIEIEAIAKVRAIWADFPAAPENFMAALGGWIDHKSSWLQANRHKRSDIYLQGEYYDKAAEVAAAVAIYRAQSAGGQS